MSAPLSRPIAGLSLAFAVALSPFLFGCSLGQGEGSVHSDELYAKDCWCSTYDLRPDFFAAVPYRDTLQIRVQRGTDLQEVSDGLAVLVDDVEAIRGSLLDKKLSVGLPLGVEPPGAGPPNGDAGVGLDAGPPQKGDLHTGCGPDEGSPGTGACKMEPLNSSADVTPGPPLVHMGLYLQQSCHNQNTVLYAVSGTILFHSLFSGDPNEKEATRKLTEAIFDVEMGDLQEVPAGAPASAVPGDKLTKLRGCFRFYFERGQPGQPFP